MITLPLRLKVGTGGQPAPGVFAWRCERTGRVAAPVMNDVKAFLDYRYLGEARPLTSGAEVNLLKLAAIRGAPHPGAGQPLEAGQGRLSLMPGNVSLLVGVGQARGDRSDAAGQAAVFLAQSADGNASPSVRRRILRAGAYPPGDGTDSTVRREPGAPH